MSHVVSSRLLLRRYKSDDTTTIDSNTEPPFEPFHIGFHRLVSRSLEKWGDPIEPKLGQAVDHPVAPPVGLDQPCDPQSLQVRTHR